ncbi:MAG: hypothetical protein PVH23_06815, partial [candidate division WOR-3 bacterium]
MNKMHDKENGEKEYEASHCYGGKISHEPPFLRYTFITIILTGDDTSIESFRFISAKARDRLLFIT